MKREYEREFHAAHIIVGHPRCGILHGHSYRVRVSIGLAEEIWLDFADLKKMVDNVLKRFDHRTLGAVNYQAKPTSEGLHIEMDIRTVTAEAIAEEIKHDVTVEVYQFFGTPHMIFDLQISVQETEEFKVITE